VSALVIVRPPDPWLPSLALPLPLRCWALFQLAGKATLTAVGLSAGLLFLFLAILPRSGLYATFTVLTASMEPDIPPGSIVVVVPTPVDDIKLGDVISFTSRQPPYPTLSHRVIGFGESDDGARVFKTKGDANLLPDPWEVRYPGRAGKVILVLPGAGYVMAASTSAAGRTVIGIAVFASLAWVWVRRVWSPPETAPGHRPADRQGQPARRGGDVHGLATNPAGAGAVAKRRRRAAVSSVRLVMFCWLLLLLLRRRI
jgi:signal peptidase